MTNGLVCSISHTLQAGSRLVLNTNTHTHTHTHTIDYRATTYMLNNLCTHYRNARAHAPSVNEAASPVLRTFAFDPLIAHASSAGAER